MNHLTYGQRIKGLIKKHLTAFAKENEFIFLKPTVLIRVKQDIMHVICFEVPPEGFYCNVVIQPLYIPEERLNLGFGDRLRHTSERRAGWGLVDDEAALEKEFIQLLQQLKSEALPWFEKTGTPDGIVAFVSQWVPGNPYLIPPIIRKEYLAYTYLYLEEFELADLAFLEYLKETTPSKYDYQIERNNRIQELRVLAKKQPDMIRVKMNDFIQYTVANLKLNQ